MNTMILKVIAAVADKRGAAALEYGLIVAAAGAAAALVAGAIDVTELVKSVKAVFPTATGG